MKKVPVYNINGEKIGEVELPIHFSFIVRKDLINRAYWSVFTHSLQPYGTDPLAGKRKVVRWRKHRRIRYRTFYGWGVSRVPRKILARYGGGWGYIAYAGAFAPFTRGGRRAHPPKVEKKIYEKINKKERLKAVLSAISATAKKEFVVARGHRVGDIELPIVFEDKFEDIEKTREVVKLLEKIGLKEELERTKKVKIRAGKGKRRGRRYKKKKGPLIVVSDKDKNIIKSARNIPGVDVVPVKDLSILHLAPGGKPGRLTIWTVSALKKLEEEKLFIR